MELTFPVIFLIERSLGLALYRSPILPSAIVIQLVANITINIYDSFF
jgi:hypothetical protein